MKVLVRVPLSPYSGYGNDGIGIVRALMRWGADVYLDANFVQAPLPADVAFLFTKTLQAPFDLIIQHVDPGALEATEEQQRSSTLVVGWTMWEYSNLHNLPKWKSLRKKLKRFDALLAYDDVTKDGFAEVYDGPILTLQGGFWPEDWKPLKRDWHSERFGFCMVGQLHERKDPFVTIKAFQELKTEHPEEFEGAELHLKTNIPGLHSAMESVIPKLRIHYAVWPNEVLTEFYAKQHVLISSSRGEGKNMPALEFMSTGGTVIATNWAGHTQWLDKSYAYPLDYTLHPVNPEFPETLNARASVEHLKELMLHLYRNRGEAKLHGDRAAEIIPKLSSWDSVIERMFLRLRTVGEKGEQVYAAAQAVRQDREEG